MGAVFGLTFEQGPIFAALRSTSYEIRQYDSYFVAEIDEVDDTKAFTTLAKYYGAIGPSPQNQQYYPSTVESVAVEERPEEMHLTAPVLKEQTKTRFILPLKYKAIDQIPVPLDGHISIKRVPRQVVAVYRFSGACTPERCLKKMRKLDMLLDEDGMLEASGNSGDAGHSAMQHVAANLRREEAYTAGTEPVLKMAAEEVSSDSKTTAAPNPGPSSAAPAHWQLAQYNPPYTPPFLRRNELWVPLDPNTPVIAELLVRRESVAAAGGRQPVLALVPERA